MATLRAGLKRGHASTSSRAVADFDPRTASAQERRVARKLRTTRVALRVDDESVQETLRFLQRVSGINFVVSSKARKALAKKERRLTMSVSDLPVENVLSLIARSLGDYRFVFRYGAVVLVRAEEHRPRRILHVYDVRDLVRPRRHFRAPRLGLGTGEDER